VRRGTGYSDLLGERKSFLQTLYAAGSEACISAGSAGIEERRALASALIRLLDVRQGLGTSEVLLLHDHLDAKLQIGSHQRADYVGDARQQEMSDVPLIDKVTRPGLLAQDRLHKAKVEGAHAEPAFPERGRFLHGTTELLKWNPNSRAVVSRSTSWLV
jgi:hypothetical protein